MQRGWPGSTTQHAALIKGSTEARERRLAARELLHVKHCPRCDRWLDMDQFGPPNPVSMPRGDHRRGYCNECQGVYQRERRIARKAAAQAAAERVAIQQPAESPPAVAENRIMTAPRNLRRSADLQAPFTAGVTADRPACDFCTWVPRDGRWELKFVSAACWRHSGALQTRVA